MTSLIILVLEKTGKVIERRPINYSQMLLNNRMKDFNLFLIYYGSHNIYFECNHKKNTFFLVIYTAYQ